MTKLECRMTNDARMLKGRKLAEVFSSLGFRHSFVIGHSSFVIFHSGLIDQHAQQPTFVSCLIQRIVNLPS